MSHYLRNQKRHSEHFSKKAARTRGGDEASQFLHLDQKSLRFSPGYRLSIKHINSSAERLASFKTQAMKERLIYIHQGIQATSSILRIMLSSLSGHWDTSGQICCHLPACLQSPQALRSICCSFCPWLYYFPFSYSKTYVSYPFTF